MKKLVKTWISQLTLRKKSRNVSTETKVSTEPEKEQPMAEHIVDKIMRKPKHSSMTLNDYISINKDVQQILTDKGEEFMKDVEAAIKEDLKKNDKPIS